MEPQYVSSKANADLRSLSSTSSIEMHHMRARSPSREPLNDNLPIHDDDFHKSPKALHVSKWRTYSAIAVLPFALAPIVVLAAAAEVASQSYIRGRECYPNGRWKEAAGATWRIMDSSYFFTPNLSFGDMTFSQVKVIDVAWDLVIGRGGQLLLAWVNYTVFNEWLVYHMERHPTSYKMYMALAFRTTSVPTLGVLGKEFLAFGERSWNRLFRWLGVLCMLLGTVYVLAFPTLMGAMTGYITTFKPYIEDRDGNLVAWNETAKVIYVINDAERLADTFAKQLAITVTDADSKLLQAIENYTSHYLPNAFTLNTTSPHTKTTSQNASTASVFYLPSLNLTASLQAPSLNITFYPTLPPSEQITPGLSHPLYLIANSTYDPAYIYHHGACKPEERFQWGFSYIFLFMVSIFNFVWSCIVVGMWVDVRRRSRMYRSGRRPGLLRSILDVGAAVREEVGMGDAAKGWREEWGTGMREEELRERLGRERGGRLVVPREQLRVIRIPGDGHGGFPRKKGWSRLTQGSTY